MNFFELVFRLGIIIAVFSFIWGVVRLVLRLLRGGSVQSVIEEYFLKSTKYIFLANVVVLTDIEKTSNELMMSELIMTGLILFMYFVSKFQKSQEQSQFALAFPKEMNPFSTTYNQTGEIIAIALGIGSFAFFTLNPQYASYGLSLWFYNGVVSLENTFIIGFIFKVIGFFFLVSIVQKIINSFFVLISGRPLFNVSTSFRHRRQNDDDDKNDKFDDYEELK
ncbi:MAG TPA: hypothetical protein PLP27_11720 [Crocinitomicaceae bacterium]|nr:hypothetical protein [Crocinitomicaceae bacterium]